MVKPKIHMEYMLFLPKHFKLSIIFLSTSFFCFSQGIVKEFKKDSLQYYAGSSLTENKIIPKEYSDQIKLVLLYYPELCKTKIKFKVKYNLAPLAAQPTLWSVFVKPSKRKYIVTISDGTIKKFNPILLKNLSTNAQIGVIGHELGHIAEYNSKRGFFFIALALKHLSKRSMDTFEYNTDKRCIEHHLGYQLLAWSEEVRIKLNLNQWGGANSPKRERYMNPTTIINVIKSMDDYQTK